MLVACVSQVIVRMTSYSFQCVSRTLPHADVVHSGNCAISLELWGYKRVEEIIWVKTNQLQRIIRTGRTGHWLNHSKEHCLVGIKGHPDVNRNIDTDVIVAEVRETSRKPDEVRFGITFSFLRQFT